MSSITTCLAANIRRLRQERGLTQGQLAQRAGISLIFLQGIEGERKWISPATVSTIAKALQVTESELFSHHEIRTKRSQFSLGKKKKIATEEYLDSIPDDIVAALSRVCRHPHWKWETFRWILDGYRRSHSLHD